MNKPHKNSQSRGERDADDRRAGRGRSAPRGERGDQNNPDKGRGRGGGSPARGQAKGSGPARGGSPARGQAKGSGASGGGASARGQDKGGGSSGGPSRGGSPARSQAKGPGASGSGSPARGQAKGSDRSRGGSGERRSRQSADRPGRQNHGGGSNYRDPVLRAEAERGRGAKRGEQQDGSGEKRPASRVYARREDRPAGRRPAPRDNRDSGVPRGGGDAERDLSRAARARLNTLRTEYDPGDDDRPGDDRDAYTDVPGGIRLQKALAQAGVASRRASEELIVEGRVSVDGHTVRRFGARVDPEASEIRVDGMLVAVSPEKRYFALHKPRGVVSTMWDPEGRPTLADYTGTTEDRLFHVGRLDTETEGLILLTNDGELANRLTHPSYQVVKTYVAKVPGPIPREIGRRVRAGIDLDDGPVKVDAFRIVENGEPHALVEVQLHEGRKHIVRRLLEAVDHPAIELARSQIGPVGINTLKPGTMRALTAAEVSELYTAAGM
ncbi:pseudouridine synthase [Streptomonospora salina]|uniref:Pseudouridine synthase n=1 Tax=Streptomonospora salina TaxID=104205 RepID=A0A841EB09_9ACTN|nr:pseudouridine synthase [Streptomonospora salina]MBB5996651.1 pseudouridine synthase [Streptomonospora salina]